MREPGAAIDALRHGLAAAGTATAVEWVAETASTNSDLVERVRDRFAARPGAAGGRTRKAPGGAGTAGAGTPSPARR